MEILFRCVSFFELHLSFAHQCFHLSIVSILANTDQSKIIIIFNNASCSISYIGLIWYFTAVNAQWFSQVLDQ